MPTNPGVPVEQTTISREATDVAVAGRTVHVETAGGGTPVVVIHHASGPLWTPFYDRLAERHRVVAPDMPGYARSERPNRARHPRDLAIGCLQLLATMGVGRAHLVGLGFGGWVAAEMATMAVPQFSSLVLVGPAGIRPRRGEIVDTMLVSFTDQAKLGFSTDERFAELFGEEPAPELVQLWDLSREMTARVTWRPWMWSLELPEHLGGVDLPALVVFGDRDRLVPLDCGEQYAQALPDARLVTVATGGHALDLERPGELADLVLDFVSSSSTS